MGIGIRVACILEVVVWTQPDAGFVCSNDFSDRLDDFDRESTPVFNGAAVAVSPDVDIVVKELVKEIAIGSMPRSAMLCHCRGYYTNP